MLDGADVWTAESDQAQPFLLLSSYLQPVKAMERVRNADRSSIIKSGVLVFTALAVLSFVLARMEW